MALLFGRSKFLFANVIILYLAYLSFYECPLTEDLRSNSAKLCYPLHQSADFIRPYYEPIDKFVEPYFTELNDKAFKPLAAKSTSIYNEYLLESVDSISDGAKRYYAVADKNVFVPFNEKISPILAKAYVYYNQYIHPQLLEFYNKASANVLYYLRILKAEIYELSLIVKYQLDTVYVPKMFTFLNNVIKYKNDVIEPKLMEFYNTVHAYFFNVVKPAVIEFFNKSIRPTLTTYYKLISNFFKNIYKGLTPNNYLEDVEVKKNFIKSEFNKIFDAGFQLSNNVQASFKNSNKLIKQKLYHKEASLIDTEQQISSLSDIDATASVSSPASKMTTTPTVNVHATPTKVDITKSINSWNLLVSKTCEAALDEFFTDVGDIEKSGIEKFQPLVTKKLQELSKFINEDYKRIGGIVLKINETRMDEEIAQKKRSPEEKVHISRKDFREILAEANEKFAKGSDELKTFLEEESNKILQEISKKKSKTLEILEEFGDFSIQEFSRTLMAVKNANGKIEEQDLDTESEDFENWSNWKKIDKIKDKIYDTKDKIISFDPELKELKKAVHGITQNLYFLANESGQYLALLRAKANVQFQYREKEEREAKIQEQKQQEEGHLKEVEGEKEQEQEQFNNNEVNLEHQQEEQREDIDHEEDRYDEEEEVTEHRTILKTITVDEEGGFLGESEPTELPDVELVGDLHHDSDQIPIQINKEEEESESESELEPEEKQEDSAEQNQNDEVPVQEETETPAEEEA
ncbi:hypothetical protein PACTADRAFT_14370 [Pachysolen tannophilus NRRL Y-2460]|uniref:Outer spore wall assembly protein SHE10 n=1 Tax=Pachysolen tannophilus NRRL Y-2460 TaxID=669874 RepID=A0A1E4U1L0_PACTA|nr:hypothetical protein PACTADRAFT_14370 [Pachysolen tannophilus NRRL Y-2460]